MGLAEGPPSGDRPRRVTAEARLGTLSEGSGDPRSATDMTSNARPTRRRNEDGVALAELALVLLPLCLVVFGAVDVGRAFIELDQLHNAAQAGALFARSYPADVVSGGKTSNCADPKNVDYQVANEQSPNGTSSLTSLGYTVSVYDMTTSTPIPNACGDDQTPATSVASGDTIEVTVSTPFHLVTPLIGSIVGNNITLHGTSEIVVP